MGEREDRELDDFLRGDSRLSAAYRQARGDEPRPEIDEVLLERARRELRLGPKVAWSPFTRAWSLPLALAAVLVVSVSVTLVMYQETGEPLPVPARPATDGPAAPADPAPKESAPAPAAGPAPLPAAKPSAPAPAQRAAPPSAETRGAGEGAHHEVAAPAADRPAPAISGESVSAPAPRTVPSARRAEEKEAPALRAKQEAASAADLGADPEAWFRRIEALRREGRDVEADALLAEFRKRFPDFPPERLPK